MTPTIGTVLEDPIDGQQYQVTAVHHDNHLALGNRVNTVSLKSGNEFVVYEDEYDDYYVRTLK